MSNRRQYMPNDEMTLQDRGDFILSFASVLFANGQSTERIVLEIKALSDFLNVRAHLMLHWDAVQIAISDERTTLVLSANARPVAASMNRVIAAMEIVSALRENRLHLGPARKAMTAIARLPPAPLWIFVLAAGGGAVAVAVLSGLQDILALSLIFASGSAGALLRRCLARWSSNLFLQPFAAALLAGIIPAIVARYDPGADLFLIAISPCLILMPGPHFLNGALDLISGRIQLGTARMFYATLVVLAISSGLLLGLAAFGMSLPVDGSVSTTTLLQDTVAAGIAIAAYSTFFAMPPRMLVWPMAIGMLAHALKWIALTALGLNGVISVFCACVIVGTFITLVSHRTHMPFAAIGFASVVSMMPGTLMFRTVSGLLQIDGAHPSAALIAQTVFNGTTAAATIVAMSVGLILPKLLLMNSLSNASSVKQLRRRTHATLSRLHPH